MKAKKGFPCLLYLPLKRVNVLLYPVRTDRDCTASPANLAVYGIMMNMMLRTCGDTMGVQGWDNITESSHHSEKRLCISHCPCMIKGSEYVE